MEVTFSKNAEKQLYSLNVRIQQKIILILERFKRNERVDIIKLKNKDDEFRIRTGNYRVQMQKIKEGFLVTKIGKRENFYFLVF